MAPKEFATLTEHYTDAKRLPPDLREALPDALRDVPRVPTAIFRLGSGRVAHEMATTVQRSSDLHEARIQPRVPVSDLPEPQYDAGMTVAKVAVTVPEETLRAVEKRRRVLGMSRSAVVSAALEAWLADHAMTAEERKYVVAYLKQPETVEEVRETTAIGAAVMAGWEPWSHAPAKPTVAKRGASKRSAAKPTRSKAKR